MSHPDRSKLPIGRPGFTGVANRTLDGSRPDWEAIGHVDAPDGAPNVLLVLIDDAAVNAFVAQDKASGHAGFAIMVQTGLIEMMGSSPTIPPLM